MKTLAHNEPLIRELLQTHWARYDIKPDDNIVKQSVEWAKSLDEDAFRYALDPANHYKTESGRSIKPRLVDLENVANNYRDARGDFYRPPLPDTSLLEEPQCLYCAEGDVYDFVFEGDKWNLKRTGTCAVCSGGTARGNPVFIEMATTLNTNVGKIVWQFSLALLEYKLTNGVLKITKADIESALEIFQRKMMSRDKPRRDRHTRPQMTLEQIRQEWLVPDILPENVPLDRIAPTKPEVQVPFQPETPVEADKYDFGDGFEREDESIPF